MASGVYKRTEYHRQRISEGSSGKVRPYLKNTGRTRFMKKDNLNEENVNWKDRPSMVALHNWVRRRVAKPELCPSCGDNKYRLELANISQEYKRDINDFEWLCHMCHMIKDGRINRLFKRREEVEYGSL